MIEVFSRRQVCHNRRVGWAGRWRGRAVWPVEIPMMASDHQRIVGQTGCVGDNCKQTNPGGVQRAAIARC